MKNFWLLILTFIWSFSLLSINEDYPDSLKKIIHQEGNNVYSTNKQLNLLSKYYHENENYAQAIKYKVQELNLHKQYEKNSSAAACNERLGIMFYHIGNYDISAEYFLQALRYFEKVDNKTMLAQIKGNLANVYTRLDNYKKAINYLHEAKDIFESFDKPNDNVLTGVYTNIALAYAGNQQYDSARYYNNKALGLLTDSQNSLYKASIFNNIGEIDFKEGAYQEALTNYQKAFDLFKSIEHYNGMGSALSNIAKIEITNGRFDLAIKQIKQSIEYFNRIDALFFIVDAYEQLSEAYFRKNEYKKAYIQLNKHLKLKDSLKGSETTEYITNLEMQYIAEKEEQKLQLLKKEAQIKEKQLQLSNLRFYITSVSIILILVITILIIYNLKGRLQKTKLKQKLLNQKQDQLKNDLIFKQKEIENFAVYIQEKNKLLQDLKKEIKNISQYSNIDKAAVNSLTNLVSQSLYVDNNRKELELKIDQTHQEFIHRLKKSFPNLTKTEIRLCSLLLLEFTSKDIAAIMNIEPSSVKTSRNRLRKKLNLPPKTDLYQFLVDI